MDSTRQALVDSFQKVPVPFYTMPHGEIKSSITSYERLRNQIEAAYGWNDTLIARILTLQAEGWWALQELEKADSLAEQAVLIYDNTIGHVNEGVADARRIQGIAQSDMQQYDRAIASFLESLEIYVLVESDTSLSSAEVAGWLAQAHRFSDRLPEGEMYARVSYYLAQARGDADKSVTIQALGQLYASYWIRGSFDRALICHELYMSIVEKRYGRISYEYGQGLYNLGFLYRNLRQWDKVDSLAQETFGVWKAVFPPNHDKVLLAITHLGLNAVRNGDVDGAIQYFETHLAREEARHGSVLPVNSAGLYYLSELEQIRGNHDKSLYYFDRLASNRQAFFSQAFRHASEKKKLDLLKRNPSPNDPRLVSLALEVGTPESIEAACTMVLNGKNLALEALATERAIAVCSDNSQVRSLLEEHAGVCDEIATISLSGRGSGNSGDPMGGLPALYAQKEELEARLSSMCNGLGESFSSGQVQVGEIANTLAPGAALIEFVKYGPHFHFPDKIPSFENWYESRFSRGRYYAAFVLRPDRSIQTIPLGDSGPILRKALLLQTRLSSASTIIHSDGEAEAETFLRAVTDTLYQLLFAPLEPHLIGVDRLHLALDGYAHLVPFEILTDADGRYLIERYEISYLSSGRYLAEPDGPFHAATGPPAIFADPDFFYSPTAPPMFAASSRGPTGDDCLANLFAPLTASADEATEIQQLLIDNGSTGPALYLGESATESRVKSLEPAPSILHLATHGFYCSQVSTTGQLDEMDNPLLYSGMVLAGANRSIASLDYCDEGGDDGFLTALEASALNLVGTDLVVLSACQTGLGPVDRWEGVFGLRRAFEQAGARSTVMSMFPVPDKATSELMLDFYTKWLSGSRKSAALREAMLKRLNNRREQFGVAHPRFWGGFILVGDPD